MPFQPATDCAVASIQYTSGGKSIANVVNFKSAAPYDQDDIDALALTVDTWVGTYVLSEVRNTVTYNQTVVRGLSSALDLEATNNDNAGTGALSGSALPNNVTFCLSLRTGLTGRSARGRFYVPPYDASKLSAANVVSSTFRDQWISILLQLGLDAAAAGWTWGVLSRRHAGVVLAEAVLRPIVDVIAVDDFVDHQDRRLPRE